MYTEQDYQEITAQWKNRHLLLWVPAGLMAAAVIATFIFRIKWATMLGTVIAGFYCVFVYGLLVQPVSAYRKHLDGVMHGRTRTLSGAFKTMEENTVTREGVAFYPMLLNVGSMDDENDDRLLFYDANLPRPDWQTGDKLTVTVHDKALGDWKREA